MLWIESVPSLRCQTTEDHGHDRAQNSGVDSE